MSTNPKPGLWGGRVRPALMAVGHVLGRVNTAILLTVVYVVFMPLIRLGFALGRRDILERRAFRTGASTWHTLDERTGSPTLDELQQPF